MEKERVEALLPFEAMQDVLVVELVDDDASKSGIVLPDRYEAEKSEGAILRVLASGPGVWDHGVFTPNLIKVGDLVIAAGYAVSKIKSNGKSVILARERDVMLRLK